MTNILIEVQAMTAENKKKHKFIVSMLALLLEFTSKCRNYCRIIVDYAWFSIVIQHLVLLDNHIYVIKVLKVKGKVGPFGKYDKS